MYVRISTAEIKSSENSTRQIIAQLKALGLTDVRLKEESDLAEAISKFNEAGAHKAVKLSLCQNGDLEIILSEQCVCEFNELGAKTYAPFINLAAVLLPLLKTFKIGMADVKSAWAAFAEKWSVK